MEQEGSEPSTKKRRTGRRCIVGGCSNESKHGFFMHRMPGKIPTTEEKFTTIQKRWITFVGRKRKFDYHDARSYSSIIVCSGHFTTADYEASDVMMYEQGLRTRPPALKNYAVPSIDLAQHPFQFYPSTSPPRPVFSSSAFSTSSSSARATSTSASSCSAPSATVPSATGASSTLTSSASAPLATVPSATSPQASAFSSSASPLNTPSNSAPSSSTLLASAPSSSAPSSPVLSSFMSSFSFPPASIPRSVISASSVTPVTTTVVRVSTPTVTSLTSAIHTPQSSHRVTIYPRKKEVRRIIGVYEEEERKKAAKQKEDERLREILVRSQGVQFAAQMRNQKVGTPQCPRGRRSCKIQVKPLSADKGLQISMMKKPAPNVPIVQMADVSTQTITESKEEEEEDEGEDFESDEFVDDEVKDPTYEPEGVFSDEEIIQVTKPSDILDGEKYIVFESNLLALFQQCISCHSTTVQTEKIRPKFFGSQLRIRATCTTCQKIWEWDSQPRVGNLMAGNILLSAAILFGGASPTKVLRVLNHMNLKVISTRTFIEHQSQYLQPAVVRVFNREQRRLVDSIEEGEKLVLGGDGRADSPGHCAKFGSYSLMDLKRKKILDIQLVQSNEVTSSNAMEREGLERCLAKLTELGLEVGNLITDRHAQVAKWIRENYPNIDHRYDVWHIAKGIQKKITAISKVKDCDAAQQWKRSIVNHVYWTASSTPDGDGELMAAKYQSLFNHVRGIHVHETEIFPRCDHEEDYPEREWLRDGSKVFLKLSDELLKTRLLNAIKKMSPLGQTSSLEAFHSVLLFWCPKLLAYSYAGIKCRLLIAALHWNENADRTQAMNREGTPMFHITFPKSKEGRATLSKVLTACTYNYVDMLMGETLSLVSSKRKVRSDLPELEDKPALSSRYERPDKEALIHQSKVHRRYSDI